MALSTIQKIPIYAGLLVFALFNYVMFLCMALTSGSFFRKRTEEEKQLFASTQAKLWDLSKQPVPGFQHAFYKLRNGHRLHFITNRDPQGTKTPSDLVVFLHGFPDSLMIWRHLLEESDIPSASAALVCVDLPGFGGSDSFEKYDTAVLDALSEFIVAMRERYTQDADGISTGYTYVCGHDWGCVLTLRLAAEAPGLADRFLISNGPLIPLVQANCIRILSSAAKIFKQFRTAPTKNFGLLKKSYATLKPLLHQAMLSGYIFVFQLPAPMLKYLATGGNGSFPRGVAEKAAEIDKGAIAVDESLGSVRPGPKESTTTLGKTSKSNPEETYGPTVVARAKSTGLAWWEMTGYYRHNASRARWEKSLETIADLHNLESSLISSTRMAQKRRSSSASSGLFTEQFKGSLHAPSTMIWGAEDMALSRAICLDGLGDYLTKDSEVIVLPRSGHWTPMEKEGRKAWAAILKALIERPKQQSPPTEVFDAVQAVYPSAQLYVRR